MSAENKELRSANSRFHTVVLRAVKIINVFAMTACFAAVWYIYYASKIKSPFYRKGNLVVVLLFMISSITARFAPSQIRYE